MRSTLAVGLLVLGCGGADGEGFQDLGAGGAPEATGGAQQVTASGGTETGSGGAAGAATGGTTSSAGGSSGGAPGASTGGAGPVASGGAGGDLLASGGAGSGGVHGSGGAPASGGAAASGGSVAAGGSVSTGGSASGGTPSLDPYPAPDCAGFTAYWVPQGGCLLVRGRYQVRSPGSCDIVNPLVNTCGAVTTEFSEGLVRYFRAEPGKTFVVERLDIEECADSCE